MVDHNNFVQTYEILIKNLINQVMDRTFNSVGSNIFLEFGEQKEKILSNGRKRLQKEWCIWLSGTSWKLSHFDKYVIGSGESSEISIQSYIEKILGRKLLSLQFVSQFLDIELIFDDGYRIVTFFNQIEENQWVIFFPDQSTLLVDCSSKEAIQSVEALSKKIRINDRNNSVFYESNNSIVNEIIYNNDKLSKLIFSDGLTFEFGLSAWRLKKNDQYIMGRKDYYFSCIKGNCESLRQILSGLIGKKLKKISTDSSKMDGILEFDHGYVLEMFTHAKTDPWKIY